MLRSLLAVAAGCIAILILTPFLCFVLGTFFPTVFLSAFLSKSGVLAILACDFLVAAVGGYVAAALAPHSRLRHALWLGAILVLFGVAMVVWCVGFSPVEGAEKEPVLWYQVGRLLVAMPAVLLGGSGAKYWCKKIWPTTK